MSPLAPVVKSVAAARRRLFLDALLGRLGVCWAVALGLSVGWFLAEPHLLDAPPDWLRWGVLGGLVGAGTVTAVIWAARRTPTRAGAALELDKRFRLNERATTALGLDADTLATPAGQAVAADAVEKVAGLKLRERFPVGLRWHAAGIPVLAAGLAGVVLFYQPAVGTDMAAAEQAKLAQKGEAVKADEAKKNTPFTARNKTAELAQRPDKSKELKELEESLNKLMAKYDGRTDSDKPEKAREKATELTTAEEKLKKFNEQKAEKLARTEQQLAKLDRLTQDDELKDGPAQKLNDALSKGDLPKAMQELDMLKKKAQDKKITPEEGERLARQLEKMKEELKAAAENKQRQDKLKDLIDKAKKEGKDAESLERELKQLQEEARQNAEAVDKLAQKLQKAAEAMKQGNMEDAADELEKAGQALKDIENDLKDLEDAEDYLQRLKEERKKACSQCKGDGQCDNPDPEPKDDAEWTEFGQPGAGRRKINNDAQTGNYEERKKGLFDPKGRKSYGGSTRGPAFKKATAAELGPAIKEAAQEAPKATADPRFPRDAKETVRDYFQNLGGQK
jgi:uncharacterized coiled-coil DUF342 family protein